MTGERELGRWGEDPDAQVRLGVLRPEHEHGLGQVHLARGPLHRLRAQARGVGEHRHLVALEGLVGEYVRDRVATHGHP